MVTLKLKQKLTPYCEYNEYREEHVVPIKERR